MIAVLARLNLVEACTVKVFTSFSHFGIDWKLHSMETLTRSLGVVSTHLRQPAHMCPVFCAVRHFLGEECRRLHTTELFRVPLHLSLPTSPLAHRGSQQSLREDSESSQDDDDNPGLAAHPRKRHRVL